MFKNISLKRKSVVFNWLFSYLVFLIIFGLLSYWIYFYTSQIIEKEINNANTYLVNSIQNDIDKTLYEAKRVGVEAMFNVRIQKLLALKKDINDQDYYDVNLLAHELKTYTASTTGIDDVYIVLKDIDKTVSTIGITDTYSFYYTNYLNDKISYQKWLNEYDDNKTDKYSLVLTSQNGIHRKILYLLSLSPLNAKDLANSVTVSINEDNLIERLSSVDKINNGTSFILSGDKIVTSSGHVNIPKGFSLNPEQKNGNIYTTIENKKVVISYSASNVNDWLYVTIVPEAVFLSKINRIKTITQVSIFLCFSLGIFLMIYFLKLNYNPINKLMDILIRESNFNYEDEDVNEYIIIEKGLKKTIADKFAIQNQLKKQNSLLKSNFIEKLLKGSAQFEIPITEALDSYDINFVSDYFTVMIFHLDDITSDGDRFNITFRDICFALSNVVEELLGLYHKGFMIEIDNVMTCIVNINPDRLEDVKADLIKAVEEAQGFMHKHFNLEFTVSVSNNHKSIDNIPIAYKEALDTMNNKMVLDIKNTLFFEDISRVSQGTFYYPITREQQLINVIKGGDYEAAVEIINDIYDVNFKRNNITADLAQCLMLNLVSTVIRAINEISPQFNDNLLEELAPAYELLRYKSVEDMKKGLDLFLSSFCKQINKLSKSSSNWVLNDVIPYIEKNYQDTNLSVVQIAEEFDFHPVYLSKLFKDTANCGLLDFIHKFRLEKAKLLMKENKALGLEELSLLVGFTNSRSFSRVFKKYEGINPSKFKETL
jgi:two-component system, response regulator YesN